MATAAVAVRGDRPQFVVEVWFDCHPQLGRRWVASSGASRGQFHQPAQRQVGADDTRLGPLHSAYRFEVTLTACLENEGKLKPGEMRAREWFLCPCRTRLGKKYVQQHRSRHGSRQYQLSG